MLLTCVRSMRAVDSNVVVRLIARDDARQVKLAEAYVEKGAWVSLVVLVETVWVLSAVYGLNASRLVAVVEMMLSHDKLVVQEGDVVTAALAQYRAHPKTGLADCLILEIAKRQGHAPLGTFDRAFSDLDGAELIRGA